MEIQSQNYAIENPQIGLPAGDTFQTGDVTLPYIKPSLYYSLETLGWFIGAVIVVVVVVVLLWWRQRRRR